MNNRMAFILAKSTMAAIFTALILTLNVSADESAAITPVKMDPEKLAGINLPAEEKFIPPEDVIDGTHQPRGEVLHYGEQLILEVYEDSPATFKIDEPYSFDEYVTILSGKLILTDADGVAHEFVAGDSLIVPKGFTGIWEMQGNFREFVVIEREAYEEAYGTAEE